MIEKVIVKDPTKANCSWASKVLNAGDVFNFKPGLNLIVGDNGCGKSTLLSTIKYYFLEGNEYKPTLSRLDYEHLNFLPFRDGIEVYADWSAPTFSMIDYLSSRKVSINSISAKMSKGSSGENTANRFDDFVNQSYRDAIRNKWTPPVKILERTLGSVEKGITDYYEKCNVKSDGLCLIMDEPDNNLSLKNILRFRDTIDHVMKTWTNNNVQYIMVIHNPILLKFFYDKRQQVNFIEMSKGFLDCIKEL